MKEVPAGPADLVSLPGGPDTTLLSCPGCLCDKRELLEATRQVTLLYPGEKFPLAFKN